MRITFCPTCGSDKVKKVRKDLVEEYRGRRYTVPRLVFYECPDCGEKIYEPEAMRRIEAISPAFQARAVPDRAIGAAPTGAHRRRTASSRVARANWLSVSTLGR